MPDQPYRYDVALSFAGEDRIVVEELLTFLSEDDGIRIFYDVWERSALWGKDLYQYLADVYQHHARFCVIFVSAAYAEKVWTSLELRSAQARALEERREYMLPIRLDDTILPGLPRTVGYIDTRTTPLREIAAILRDKVRHDREAVFDVAAELRSTDAGRRATALSLIAIRQLRGSLSTVGEILLRDPDAHVRTRAAWALDNLKTTAAVDALLAALSDPAFSVRSAAGWALVHLGPEVRPKVQQVLDDSDNEDARLMAQMVLDRI